MTSLHDMPPDPFAEEGVDSMTLERAERLAREGITGDDPRWRALEDEGPLVEDFDTAADSQIEHEGSGPRFWNSHGWAVAAVSVLVAFALLLLFVR